MIACIWLKRNESPSHLVFCLCGAFFLVCKEIIISFTLGEDIYEANFVFKMSSQFSHY